MKKSACKLQNRLRVVFGLLCVCVLTGVGFMLDHETRAESGGSDLYRRESGFSLKSFRPQREDSLSVNMGERVSPWIRLQPGKPLDTTFYGRDEAISALRTGPVVALSQISADFNADGFDDLISGFRNPSGGGLIVLHRAAREAFEPTDERVLEDLRRGIFPAAFEKDALVLNVPAAPDFILAGKFTRDAALDLVIASRGGDSVFLVASDGRGGFNEPREIDLGGEITALASDTLDASKNHTGLVAALKSEKSSTVVIFDGTAELAEAAPRRLSVEGEVSSLILASPSGAVPAKDIFGLAGGAIFSIDGGANQYSAVRRIETPSRALALAAGEFIRDREARTELAVLSEDGSVSYLRRGALDERPFTVEEIIELRKQTGRGRSLPADKESGEYLSDAWQLAEQHSLGAFAAAGDNPARMIQKAYITGNETEDLLVVDPQSNRLRILFKEPDRGENRTSFTGETKFQNVDFADTPEAVLPMRLNVMGQQGFVVYGKDSLDPVPVMFVPNATFTVTKTPDTNDGVCNADCSLREAVVAANTAPGADMVVFGVSGVHTLTVAGINENSAASGDLDIRESKTIVGNGAGNTIIEAGTNTTNGIDKVFSINPTFSSAFATSLTGFTVRHGRNQSSFAGDGFGGGLDWEASGTGTLTISGLIVTLNSTLDGDGGGIVATSFPTNNAFISITGSTISNNDPDRAGSASPIGGGLFVGTGVTYRLTNTVVTNNNVTESFMQGQGGGIFAFGPASAAGKSFLTGSAVTNNSAPSDGGGIYTTQPVDINPTAIISNNASGRSGGGIFVNHAGATTIISKATMAGNAAANSGGAIFLGSAAPNNNLTVSFSRIVGNTAGLFGGLAVNNGIATVENNWWGCNTGPTAAPCDTAGVTGIGSVDFNPWLQLRLTAASTTLVVGQPTTLTASFLMNSAGGAVAAGNLDVLIGLPVTWGAAGGTITGAQTTVQANGQATASFSSTTVGAKSATAQVDSGQATVNITVNKADTTTTITGESADPTAQGQVFTVFYSVTVNAPGAGSPTGNVTVSDGANSCTGTVAAGQCSLFLNNAGTRTLTATYASDANFNASVSAGEPHTVLPIVAASVTISGRVQTQTGRGIANARVVLADQDGQLITAVTNGFGYYRFEGIPVGETYVFNVRHKQYRFAPQVVTVFEDVQKLNFTALN